MAAPVELDTPDELVYRFYPVSNGIVQFRVRAPNDAHLALCSGPAESDPMYEVFLGGWKNTKSVIRKNRTKPDVAETETPDILNEGEYRGFWIRWCDNMITVGYEGQVAAFLTYEDTEKVPINYVGVCTGWGAAGSWIIEAASAPSASAPPCGGMAYWCPCTGDNIPADAIEGGIDAGEPLYIGRARHEGAMLPGKVVRSHGVCYVPFATQEHAKSEYEVLCGATGFWVPASNGEVPGAAFQGGESEDGEPLFIGRVQHEGTLTLGKVHPSCGSCYVPYGGAELAFADYEVFVMQ